MLIIVSNIALADDNSLEWGERLQFFRWLEDYDNFEPKKKDYFSPIKHITLVDLRKPYLTIGGDYRNRYEYYSNQFFGLISTDSSNSQLQRFLLHGDLQFKSSRVFVQLSQHVEQGLKNGPRPLDESEVDIHQAFFDQRLDWGMLRIGRQEFSLAGGKKTGVREGPNQRRSFDGVSMTILTKAEKAINIFYLQEVQPSEKAFRDSSNHGPQFYGIYGNKILKNDKNIAMDLFYYGFEQEQRKYEQGIGQEKRHSIGVRFYKNRGDLHFDYEMTYQFGEFEQYDISAWGIATETSVQVDNINWIANWGVRLNYASGDDDSQDTKLGTYNSLFPSATYVSFAPGNMKDIQPFVVFQPSKNITLFTGIDFLWRVSKGDGLYVNTGFPLVTSNASTAMFYGTEINLVSTWKLNDFFTIQSNYTKTNVGKFIKDSNGINSDFFMLSVALHF